MADSSYLSQQADPRDGNYNFGLELRDAVLENDDEVTMGTN